MYTELKKNINRPRDNKRQRHRKKMIVLKEMKNTNKKEDRSAKTNSIQKTRRNKNIQKQIIKTGKFMQKIGNLIANWWIKRQIDKRRRKRQARRTISLKGDRTGAHRKSE